MNLHIVCFSFLIADPCEYSTSFSLSQTHSDISANTQCAQPAGNEVLPSHTGNLLNHVIFFKFQLYYLLERLFDVQVTFGEQLGNSGSLLSDQIACYLMLHINRII